MGLETDDHNSHAVALVKVDGEWVVEDPTFNTTYVSQDGEPISIHLMVDLLEQRESHKIIEHRGEASLRYAVSFSSPDWWGSMYPIEEVIGETASGLNIYKIDSRRQFYSMDVNLGNSIENMGYPNDVKYLFLFPIRGDIYSHITQ